MNTKRQKVWLVSMLSLMVVLSAYYLLTDDVNEGLDAAAMGGDSGAVVQENLDDTYNSQFMEDGADDVMTNEDILAQMEADMNSSAVMSASNKLDSLYLSRDKEMNERYNEIYQIINDDQQSTAAISQAYTDLHALEDQYAMIESVEDQLYQDYGNAVITQDNDKWHVHVQANELSNSQAVKIIDMVTEEMSDGRQVLVSYLNN